MHFAAHIERGKCLKGLFLCRKVSLPAQNNSEYNAGTLASQRKDVCIGARQHTVRQRKKRAEVHHILVNMVHLALSI